MFRAAPEAVSGNEGWQHRAKLAPERVTESPLQGRGRRFEPCSAHQDLPLGDANTYWLTTFRFLLVERRVFIIPSAGPESPQKRRRAPMVGFRRCPVRPSAPLPDVGNGVVAVAEGPSGGPETGRFVCSRRPCLGRRRS